MKHLVLLGGGTSHLRFLRELALVPLPDTQVTWLVPHSHHVDAKMLPAWVAGRCTIEDITVPLQPLANAAQVDLVEGEVMMLDAARHEVTLCSGRTLVFDALSVCGHAVSDRDAIRGAREHALFTRPVQHFIRLWEAVLALAADQTLNLAVVGDRASAIEMAMAVQKRLAKRARVALVTHGGAPLADYPEALQRRVREVLKRGQVTLFEDRCEALSSRQMLLSQGMRLACDAPVLTLEESSPPWLTGSDLHLDERGMIVTVSSLQSASHPQVFADGELARRADRVDPAAPYDELYRMGDALSLGHNLRSYLAGGELAQDTRHPRGVYAVACGDGSALASLGPFSIKGRWVGTLKERADRRRLDNYRGGPAAGTAGPRAAERDEPAP